MKKCNPIYYFTIVSTLIALLTPVTSCNNENLYPDPLTPEAALSSFTIDDNFTIELFASEPFVEEPIEMIFDEKGNIFIIEMPDFADDTEDNTGNNRIKVLRDTNHDGKIDDYIVFADGIKEATSLQPWKGGLLVTAAPYIYYLKDTNGDFIADEKETLFTGFFQNNQEAQITNLRFNIDNWIYANNHGQPGKVVFERGTDTDTLFMDGADFRFRLDQNKFERETAPGQFGQALNDSGHRFVTQNTIHIQQIVIPYRYLHRQEFMPTTKGVLNVSDHDLRMYQLTEAPYWRMERSNRRQKKYDEQGLDRTEYIDNHFTGASGGAHYGGHLFPQEYYGNIFTGEVTGNLVHRDVLTMPDNLPHYTARRAPSEQQKEFLASSDMWFRPVNFTIGPDGALYVIDMYRQHIEAPFSIPDDLRKDMDFKRGEDMGRIYRIVPKGSNPPVIPGEVTMEKSPEDYVEWLSHPNQWYRLHAQRMLLEAQDASVVPAVRELFADSDTPYVRLHAFYVLEGLGAMDMELVEKALNDPSVTVKEYALIQAENYPETLSDVISLKDDPSARVVLQTALSLGEFTSDRTVPALGEILINHYNDLWIRLGVISSEKGSSIAMMQYLSKQSFFEQPDSEKEELMNQLGYIIAARNRENESTSFLNTVYELPAELQKTAVQGYSAGAKRAKIELSDDLKLKLKSLSDIKG